MTNNMTAAANPPLTGIRVLDLSRIAAGPFCTMQLSDLGAEIIKVEQPGHGDDTRHMKPPQAGGEAHYYLAYNRGKKSVALDMKTPEGREIIHRLAAKCDVLIQNFRPGVMERLGLGYADMKDRHPHLIYCSISSYGQQGMMADRPGFDPVLQAEFGLMSLTGAPDGDPIRAPISLTDMYVALYASTAILASVIARKETGRGQHIDLALMDGAAAVMSNLAQYYFCSGESPPRTGNTHATAVPAAAFHAKGGMFYLACGTDRLFRSLCEKVIERPDLLEDPKYRTNSARAVNRAEVMATLEAIFADGTREAWVARCRKAGVPAGPVRSVAEAMESPELKERNMVVTVPHPTAGALRMLGTPFKLSESPTKPPTAPPLLGEHTEEVLRDVLGMDAAAVARLKESKTIR
ncbi:MAG: CoA transferase [Alphaproteobacteria bacterium]|nr:CoA transferase [Alphaproteobacteria bacterium]